jgi:hypothetical protein
MTSMEIQLQYYKAVVHVACLLVEGMNNCWLSVTWLFVTAPLNTAKISDPYSLESQTALPYFCSKLNSKINPKTIEYQVTKKCTCTTNTIESTSAYLTGFPDVLIVNS